MIYKETDSKNACVTMERKPGELQRLIETLSKENGDYGELLNELEVVVNKVQDRSQQEVGINKPGEREPDPYAPGFLYALNEQNYDIRRRNQRLRELISRLQNEL